MKTTLSLATATAALLIVVGSVSASEPLLSPRAKEMADSLAKSGGVTLDVIDRSAQAGSGRQLEFAASLRKVSGTTEDMIVRGSSAVTPKLRDSEPWRLERYQVAPVK